MQLRKKEKQKTARLFPSSCYCSQVGYHSRLCAFELEKSNNKKQETMAPSSSSSNVIIVIGFPQHARRPQKTQSLL